MPADNSEEIVLLLTHILKITALQAVGDKSVTEGARMLKLVGLDNQTIAAVLNTTPATIRAVTANLRSTGRKGR